MLLALRQYSLPVVLAVAMHAGLVAFLWHGIGAESAEARIIKPNVINSKLLVMEPKASRARAAAPPPPSAKPEVSNPEKIDQRLLEDQRREREETRRKTLALEKSKREAEQKEREAREESERQRAQAEQDRAARLKAAAERARADRQERLDALSTSSAAQEAADAQAEGEEAELAQAYFQGIRAKIVANWSRPASARNGMKVTLRVDLVPNGTVTAVSLVETSGDAAFDRSAETAVRQAGRFEVPDDSQIFERRFRRFNLLFNPEDLLR